MNDGESEKKEISFFLFAYWHDSRWQKFIGATVKIWDLAHNLADFGHKVVLFLPKYRFDKDTVPFKIVEIPFLDFPVLRHLSFNCILAILLFIYFFKPKPDIVYMRRMSSIVPALYAKLCKAVLFYEVNDDPFRREYHEGSQVVFKIRSFLSKKQDEIDLKLCDRCFVISTEIEKKILEKISFVSVNKFRTAPSGANIDLFIPLHRNTCKSHLNLDRRYKYVGFAGTLLKHQGIDVLINAVPAILRKEPQSFFIIIGEGPMKDIWKKRIEKEGLQNCFLFPGQVSYSDMPIWIGAMDICVAPFLKTAGLRSPVKIFDYMACGRAVVASLIEGTTDIFSSSGAIKLVSPQDPSVLASAILDLLQDKEKADRMGKTGRELIVKHFDRRAIAKQISDEAIACALTL
jgi:glycosyltransferase involved in cell wall biosynthesis